MELTALQIQSASQGKTFGAGFPAYKTGEYRGAVAAARFGNPQAEWAELRFGCGVYDLGYRAKISLTGADRVRWLNGMVTNNIRDLAADRGVYAFLLNPQGHILGDLYAYNRGDSILIDTDRSQLEKILATFDHYIIMDDVEGKESQRRINGTGHCRTESARRAQQGGYCRSGDAALAGCRSNLRVRLRLREMQSVVVRGQDSETESYDLWLSPSEVSKTWDALLAAGASPVGFEAIELQRIVSGIPLYGVDIRERDLPQETEQERALNFNKGCYVGQEIIERIRSRGAVHRKFSGFIADGVAAIPPGNKIVAGEKEVGEITSVAALDLRGVKKTVALGYLRREVSTPGREVVIAGVKAIVASLPINFDQLHTDQPSQPEKVLEQNPA